MKISGNVFLVTGGASGLGEGTVRLLASRGGKVIIMDRDQVRGATIARETGAHYVECDLTEEDSIEESVRKVASIHGTIHGCVNCAGTGLAISTVSRVGNVHDMGSFEFVVRLNLLGTFSVASKCAGIMIKNQPGPDGERGIIINVASVAAFDGQNGQAAYSASKAGVVGMALPMARDLGSRGIRVNTIAPGTFSTPMTAGMDPGKGSAVSGKGKRVGNALLKAQVFPNNRFGVPLEFATTVEFLITNRMMNAHCIRLDGGIRMPKL
eukprot:g4944.t1